jgi:ribosome-binding factor A
MSLRTEKVSGLIKDELGYIIEKYLRSEITGFLTITRVVMSGDLKHARIFVSVFNQEGDKEEIIKKLNFNKKRIKSILAPRVSLKFLPDIFFVHDDSFDEVEKLEKIFKKIHEESNQPE